MSLLTEIRDAAVDGNVPIATMLRKCAVLAARLDTPTFRTWVSSELNGYQGDASELPPYRILSAPARGNLAGPFGSGYRNIAIPSVILPEDSRRWATEVALRQPISAIDAIVNQSNESGELSCPWPGDLIALMQGKFDGGMVLYAAWQALSRSQLVGVVDTVRNRVLEFVLELEREAPEAGESNTAAPKEKAVAQQLIQTIIYGNVGNLAAASPGALQSATIVSKGDLIALSQALKELGLPSESITELQDTLQEESEAQGIGPKTAAWLSKVSRTLASGAVKVGSGVSVDAVVKLLSTYLGL